MKKNHTLRTIGIILIILQIMSLYGSFVINKESMPQSILEWIGLCLFGIIGIILIIQDVRKNK